MCFGGTMLQLRLRLSVSPHTSLVDSLLVTISWIVTGRQENTKFLPAAALFTGKQFVSSDV